MTATCILVVEDDEKCRRLLIDVLSYHGYRVIPFASAESAADWLDEEIVDGAILDIHLPGMSGADFLRELRARPGSESLPVLAMSANEPVQTGPAQFDAFLPKPMDLERLCAEVAKLIGAPEAPRRQKR